MITVPVGDILSQADRVVDAAIVDDRPTLTGLMETVFTDWAVADRFTFAAALLERITAGIAPIPPGEVAGVAFTGPGQDDTYLRTWALMITARLREDVDTCLALYMATALADREGQLLAAAVASTASVTRARRVRLQ